MKRRALACLALASLLAGCMPYRYTERPGIAGTVISLETGRPIASARVDFTLSHSRHPGPVHLTTNERGEFSLPSVRRWGIIWPQFDPGRAQATIEIAALGHAPVQRMEHWSPVGPSKFEFREVGLRRLKASP